MRILYISHNSIGTALVRSQVLPYLRELATGGVESQLLTFERGTSFPSGEFEPRNWSSLPARPGSGLLPKAFDALRGVARATALIRRRRPALIHARSYLPAAIALVAGAVTRRPFIFDMRGFLGEEYTESGHWSAGDLRLRVLRTAELLLLRAAAGIVVLTDVAATRLRTDPRYRSAVGGKPVVVVPCAVDLTRFRPASQRSATPTLVFAGTLADWYLLDEMLAVFAHARALVPELRFLFLNRDERDRIRTAVERSGLATADVTVTAADFAEMPAVLAGCHVGIVFAKPKRSIGASPIKVAEYLSVGLPVVVNAGMGDVDRLVLAHGAGHVARTLDDEGLREAARAVARLVGDHDTRANARRLAESEYDVKVAASRYRDLYTRVAAG